MNLDHLSDGDFEEFTYDLLVALGFTNLSWRRGSGKGGASADQGRDIIAQELHKTLDSKEHLETWFVQCKHYVQGVPPEKLNGALTWANAERPAVLLFVVSNFLSNPSKTYLEDYERNNRPPFRVKIWERKDLERLLSSHPTLMRKYRLDPGDPTLTAHAAHLQYALNPTINTLEFFFAQLDNMDPTIRDQAFGFTFYAVIKPRLRKPKDKHETLADLMLDKVDYAAFRSKCRELARSLLDEHFIIQAVVTDTLGWMWRFGDATKVDSTIARNKETIAYFTQKMKSESDPDNLEALRKNIAISEELIAFAHERQKVWAGYYRFLCETLLPTLALEQPRLRFSQDSA